MPDRKMVIKRLEKVSYYFKSLLAVGWQGDADIYREHMESVNMAIALLKEHDCAVHTDDDWFYRDYKRCEKKSSNAFLAGVITGFLLMVIALRMEGII